MMARVELLDRQIVDADELDSAIDEILRAIRSEVGVVLHELRFDAEAPSCVSKAELECGSEIVVCEIVLRRSPSHHPESEAGLRAR